jgi:hypothetical protein
MVSLPFSENFQSTAPSSAAITDYPAFTYAGTGATPSVDAGGVLHLPAGASPNQYFTVTPTPTPTNELIIRGLVGAVNGDGGFNVGITVGNNRITFHPGYPGGAFRVNRVNDTEVYSNQTMNFNPASNVLYQFEIHSFPDGLFTMTVADTNSAAVYTAPSFTDLASYGGQVGFHRSGGGGASQDGLYDNLSIVEVPEPSTLLLGLFAIGALVATPTLRKRICR